MENQDLRKQVRLINEAYCQIIEAYGEWAKRHGLSYNELMILYDIDELKGCTQRMISKREGIPKQTVNSILSAFKAKGYVRYEADCRDKREKIIYYTAAGEAYAKPLLLELSALEERAMAGLGCQDASRYVRINQNFADLFCSAVAGG